MDWQQVAAAVGGGLSVAFFYGIGLYNARKAGSVASEITGLRGEVGDLRVSVRELREGTKVRDALCDERHGRGSGDDHAHGRRK